jgi:hypothetical protein
MATLIKMQEDANTTTDDDDSLLAEMERKAELKRRIESYHVEWLRCERDQDQVPGGSLPRTNGCSAGPSVLHLL